MEGRRCASGDEGSEVEVKKTIQQCPCGGASYAQCCGKYHGGLLPETAEQLMRSRYSAYVLGLTDYLLDTWHASTRPKGEELNQDPQSKWLGLEVKKHVPAGDRTTVEFVARYKVGGRAHRLHEISNFVREDGKWFYVDGTFPEK
jgi:SEC-C motif-containing protein